MTGWKKSGGSVRSVRKGAGVRTISNLIRVGLATGPIWERELGIGDGGKITSRKRKPFGELEESETNQRNGAKWRLVNGGLVKYEAS